MVTLSEIKRHNKKVGRFFFSKGNPPVLAKKGNYLVTRGVGEGFIIYKYDSSNGQMNLVDNPDGEYTWQPYDTKAKAVAYATFLSKKIPRVQLERKK